MTQFGKPLPSAVPAKGRSSLLTYEPYYGLREKPFSLSADPRFLYKSPSHAPTFEDLRAGIRRREGLIVLTGDIGMGKTTLVKAVLEDLDRKTFSAFVPDPFLSREDLLKMLLIEFGVMSIEDVKSGRLSRASRPELSYPLYEFLKSLVPLQAYAVLVIDEAQNLSPVLLEEIRILSELEAPEKLLQLVLVGQLELQAKLKLDEMRQVDQRVSVRCELKPLTRDVVSTYIDHRLDVAGGGRDRVQFSDAAVDEIFRVSQGVPRLVNLICDRSLHHGHLERSANIHSPHVVRAVFDLGLRRSGEAPAAPRPVKNALDGAKVQELPVASAPVATLSHTFLMEDAATDEVEEPVVSSENPVLRIAALTAIGTVLGSLVLLLLLSARDNFAGRPPEALSIPALPPSPKLISMQSVASLPMHIAASAAMAEAPALYSIDVAMFDGPERPATLVDELSAAGYKPYVATLQGARGRVFVVRMGPYILRADADADVAKIRRMPGYADARVTPVLTAPEQ